jgi:hypothetical protein|tara:strand:- start:612 stop:797 length:186 start_codon:yes stop_codon:yes gene_type:complete
MTTWEMDLKIRQMLNQILERLGEKTTPEIMIALGQVQSAMDNLKVKVNGSMKYENLDFKHH